MQKIFEHSNNPIFHKILFTLLYFFSIIILFNSGLTGKIDATVLFNSDALYPYSFVNDVLLNGKSIKTWAPPPAPYLFPDLFFFATISLFTNNAVAALISYFFIQQLLFIAAFSLFFYFFGIHRFYESAVGLMTVFNLLPVAGESLFYLLVQTPAHHTGQLLLLILSVSILCQLIQNGESHKHTGKFFGLLIISSTAIISDKLYTLTFIFPAVLTLTIVIIHQKWTGNFKNKNLLIAAVLLLASFYTGLYLYKQMPFIKITIPVKKESYENIVLALIASLKLFRKILKDHSLFSLVHIGIFAFFLIKLFQMIIFRETENSKKIFLYVYCIFMPISIYAGTILKGIVLDIQSFSRYFFSVGVMYAAGFLIASSKKQILILYIYLLLMIPVIGFMFIEAGYSANTWNSLTKYRPPGTECMDALSDKYGLNMGISDYWKAKYTTAFSKKKLEVHQIWPDGRPYYWINNYGQYADASYRFIIIAGLNRESILKQFGKPFVVERCYNDEVFIYTKAFQLRL